MNALRVKIQAHFSPFAGRDETPDVLIRSAEEVLHSQKASLNVLSYSFPFSQSDRFRDSCCQLAFEVDSLSLVVLHNLCQHRTLAGIKVT